MSQSDERIAMLTQFVSDRGQRRKLERAASAILSSHGRKPRRQDLEDVLSEAYIAAVRRLKRDKKLEIDKMAAWFRRFIFYACCRHHRVNTQFLSDLEAEGLLLEQLSGMKSTEDQILANELLGSLDSEEDREILKLSSEGLTSKEIGHHLELSPASVRQRKSRAIRAIRDRVNKQNGKENRP